MNKDVYSPLKIFHHQDRINDMKQGLRPKPLHAQLILVNLCNQDCSFCAYRSSGYSSNENFDEKSIIKLDKALETVHSLRKCGVKAIELTGGGEPTIYPGFATVCEFIKELGMQYGVVTNGVKVSDPCMKALLGAAWVRVSIDAGSSETYASIRRSSVTAHNTVQNNLRKLIAQRGSNKEPYLGIGFVVTKENWREVLIAAHQARDIGADNFRISAVFQNEGAGYFKDFYEEASHLCREAKALQTKKFTVFNLFGERLDDLEQQSPSHVYCPIQHLVPYIGADLNVYRCCVLAYSERGLLGSIKDCTFEELWNSEEVADKLRKFNATQCPRCMFNKKNETIRYALTDSPDHVNFL